MAEHTVPKKIYVAIWATLMAMTLITTLVAFVDLGRFNTVVALAIATFKASPGGALLHGRKIHAPADAGGDHLRHFFPGAAAGLQHGRLPDPAVAGVGTRPAADQNEGSSSVPVSCSSALIRVHPRRKSYPLAAAGCGSSLRNVLARPSTISVLPSPLISSSSGGACGAERSKFMVSSQSTVPSPGHR